VRQDFDVVGRRSVAALLRLVDPASLTGEPGEPGAVGERVAPVLVVRRSTAPARP
jgi:hypothetical protein